LSDVPSRGPTRSICARVRTDADQHPFDATDAVKRLAAEGRLVRGQSGVLSTDGTPAADALKIDAVSLNFFDRPLTSKQ
jgi:hypothetical protein